MRGLARRVRSGSRGFTLIEAALATVIIGVGVVAIIEAQGSFMRSNNWSSHAATGTLLGNEIRELSNRLPRHDPVTGLWIDDSTGEEVLVGWGIEANELTIDDIDDVDDLDGLVFGSTGTFPGPIDAFGQIIPQTLPDGTVVLGQNGEPLPLEGWTQSVTVEKISPTNFATLLENDYRDDPNSNPFWRDVHQFPLRVTVTVTYQGPFDVSPTEVTRVSWIVP